MATFTLSSVAVTQPGIPLSAGVIRLHSFYMVTGRREKILLVCPDAEGNIIGRLAGLFALRYICTCDIPNARLSPSLAYSVKIVYK